MRTLSKLRRLLLFSVSLSALVGCTAVNLSESGRYACSTNADCLFGYTCHTNAFGTKRCFNTVPAQVDATDVGVASDVAANDTTATDTTATDTIADVTAPIDATIDLTAETAAQCKLTTPPPTNACTNATDKAIVAGFSDLAEVINCETKSGIKPSAEAVACCLVSDEKISPECATCFGNLMFCLRAKCESQCYVQLGGSPNSNACQTCDAANDNCIKAAETCTGPF